MEVIINLVDYYLGIVFALRSDANVIQAMLLTFVGFLFIYTVFTLSAWLLLRHGQPASFINTRPLRQGQYRFEIQASMISIVVFAILAAITFESLRAGWLRVAGEVSISRWMIEVLVLYFWNEIHFYACHRVLHVRKLFNLVHVVHHRSTVVTPFAVYRFHWIEAALLGSVMPLAMVMHDFSVWSLLLLPPLSLLWNVIGHSNWQSSGMYVGWLSRASQRHAAHHSIVNGNYGFSMPYLDWLFNTALKKNSRIE